MRVTPLSLFLLLFSLPLFAQEETPAVPDSTEVFRVIEEMPRFPGCENPEMTIEQKQECAFQKMLEFLFSNLQYPALARENGIEGMVVIQFVVERDGSLSNIEIAHDIGAGCGEEAKRVVELMNTLEPRWTPGKLDGEPVRVQFNLPVKYKLEGREKKKKKSRKG